ncbi:MAG TPA: alpha-glucuronidase family glycosyl hydrolase, partial [Bacteroidales bacterium]|nr:alpha-glucuronidase family glycosyl hydrolase [Bacteroidales bacterium]
VAFCNYSYLFYTFFYENDKELKTGLSGLLGKEIATRTTSSGRAAVIIGKAADLGTILNQTSKSILSNIKKEGFLIFNAKNSIVITANDDVGVLYGAFRLLKLIQTNQDISNLNLSDAPALKVRVLNHWDNLDRTVERGYAGFSLWDWHRLPGYLDPRYRDYARANASIGINGTVLTNVNANALVLTEEYLAKVQALANVFRPYGIKVYLTARFSAPVEIGGLKTADPLDPDVKAWWNNKVKEIFKYIPDFGGFLVKANSEGQPGPQNYGRNHADGANMLAEALAPYDGIVMWRAFVYDNNVPEDRAKQAYNEFTPLDGKFLPNVLVQVKNGPIDFQPREPVHPLFGAMPKTPLMMEFQITQEYLGFAVHQVYLGTLFEECLQTDTHIKGNESTIARVIDGSLENHTLTGMAGVANIGNDIDWCGNPMAQANWYAFGRLAWKPQEKAEAIAADWIKMTFSNIPECIRPVKEMMMMSREAAVNYMTPLGLHHLMGWGHHYGPGPWVANKQRADWTSVYYHRADSLGIGFNRSSSGSSAVSQYSRQLSDKWDNLETCPPEYLLWFHHISWNYKMKSGKTLWEELCFHYYAGVDSVRKMKELWNQVRPYIDSQRYEQTRMLLTMQEKEAIVWRNSCVLYFQTFSHLPIPAGLEAPEKSLDYYMSLKYSYVPGI